MNKVALAVSVVLLSILFIVWWPLAVIWGINTLFRADIPYTLSSWAAVFVLATLLRASTLYSEKQFP